MDMKNKALSILLILVFMVLTLSLSSCRSSGSDVNGRGAGTIENGDNMNSETTDHENAGDTRTSDKTKDGDTNLELDEKVFEHGLGAETLIYNFNNFINNNLYISFQKSSDKDEYDNLIKLPTSESVTYYNNGSTSIKDKDNRMVYFGENISMSNDFDYLDLMTNAVNLIGSDIVTVKSVDLTKAYKETVYEFVIDIHGYENCEKFYSQLNDAYGKLMRANLEESANNNGYDTEESPINLRFAYVIDKTGITSGGFYTYFSNKQLGLDEKSWNECYAMWFFEDYWKIGDWSFPNSWYEFDFDKAIKENNTESLVEIGQSVCDNANKSAEKHYSTIKS